MLPLSPSAWQTALDALADYGALGDLPVSNQMDLFSFS